MSRTQATSSVTGNELAKMPHPPPRRPSFFAQTNDPNDPCLPVDPPPAPAGGWGVAELHCHTTASDGRRIVPKKLVEIAERSGP